MKKNMGIFDRAIRLLLAAVIGGLYFTKIISGAIGVMLLVLAGIFILTGLIRLCPLYLPFGFRTNGKGCC